MEQKGNRLFLRGMDHTFDTLFHDSAEAIPFTSHFAQGEDFFIRLPQEILVPSFPIHHDFRVHAVTDTERPALSEALANLAPYVGHMTKGTRFFFDPTENQKPSFYQIITIDDQQYAYIFRIDLAFRPSSCRIVQRGTNDFSCVYASRNFFVESDLIPLVGSTENSDGSVELRLSQSISETWIGETGRGYFLQGIWLDREISKFFTKLFIPKGKRLYPYFPLNCKFRSTCMQTVDLSESGRFRATEFLHKARSLLDPHISNIEKSLHKQDFSEELDSFVRLKSQVPPAMEHFFDSFAVKAYLNDQEMKEYEITF